MKWDSTLYDNKHGFVAEYGKSLLQFVPQDPKQRILDIGCGTGTLTQELSKLCRYVLGTDSSAEMIERAKKQYPHLDFQVTDALALPWQGEWDVVFSNAVFHWIADHDLLLSNIRRALKPGGYLVCEFGAFGNISVIETAFSLIVEELGYPYRSKFNFTTVQQFGTLLEKNGFAIEQLYDYDRPTPLQDGSAGLENWARQFFAAELEAIPARLHPELFERLQQMTSAKLWNGKEWVADYRRMRAVAYI